jgi:hypothetical protein
MAAKPKKKAPVSAPSAPGPVAHQIEADRDI